MESLPIHSILSKQSPIHIGQLLYSTQIKLQQNQQQPYQTEIRQHCIVINHNTYIHYSFDLKVLIIQSQILFQYQDDQLILYLVNHDHQKWKQILKNYLNQRGFHAEFKPIKKIGKGNFASVYMAQNLQNKQNYAIKAFSKEAAFSEEHGKECLIKQIEIMRSLNHKNNMKLHEVYESQNSLYIVFELLEGGQLYDKIKNKHKFTKQQVKTIVRGLLEGLNEMHSKKIMHRDLKPQNILFRQKQDYDCVIADYGLSQFCDTEKYLFVRCGTPGYVAPQVINIKQMSQRYTSACDIFSLGLIFHLLLMGKSIFKGSSYNQVLSENRACNFNLETSQYENLQAETLDLLKKMLKKNPEERISAQLALYHPYFKEQQDKKEDLQTVIDQNNENEQQVQQKALGRWIKRLSKIQKDSCLKLQKGKQNILNGKTDTLNNMNSTKISFVGNGNKYEKVSKFTRDLQKQKQKQNHKA